MAQKVDYAALKKGGYMRQKQKGYGSLRLAVVGGNGGGADPFHVDGINGPVSQMDQQSAYQYE